MYEAAKQLLLHILCASGAPPAAPAGSPASVQVFRAAPSYLKYNLVVLSIFFAILVGGLGIVTLLIFNDANTPRAARFVLAGVFMLALLAWILAHFGTRLEYDMRYYIITDRSLRIRHGVWKIVEITLTYANVQHLEIQQGPIQQLLEISDLYVRTAGGSGPAQPGQEGTQKGHRAVFRGIENASALRDHINVLLRQYRQAGLGDPEERVAHQRQQGTGLSPLAVQRLREIRDDLVALRQRPMPPGAFRPDSTPRRS